MCVLRGGRRSEWGEQSSVCREDETRVGGAVGRGVSEGLILSAALRDSHPRAFEQGNSAEGCSC